MDLDGPEALVVLLLLDAEVPLDEIGTTGDFSVVVIVFSPAPLAALIPQLWPLDDVVAN